MRLEKFISHATTLTRSQVAEALRQGRVTVDGEICRSTSRLSTGSTVCLDARPLEIPQPVYLMLNKPTGTVCATTDSEHPTVVDLLNPRDISALQRQSLQIAGRLDLDTTGLVLITTDGQWNHRITSPRGPTRKTYLVQLSDPLSTAAAIVLENGILLRSESHPTLPCEIAKISEKVVKITLQEGRYHQVKRMFAAVGNHVVALHRLQVGSIQLDPALIPGQYRMLNRSEIDTVEL